MVKHLIYEEDIFEEVEEDVSEDITSYLLSLAFKKRIPQPKYKFIIPPLSDMKNDLNYKSIQLRRY